jgi:hypothetical protein
MAGKMPRKLVEGSIPHRVSQLPVGGSMWIETTAKQYRAVERAYALPPSRRSLETKSIKVRCSVWQALPVGRLADEVMVLVRVERVA